MTLQVMEAHGLLERYYRRFDYDAHIVRDPVHFAHGYEDRDDVEAVAFVAATLAFGRVAAFRPVLTHVVGALGEHPASTLRTAMTDPAASEQVAAAGTMGYRWLEPADVEAMLRAVGSALAEYGTLESAFGAARDRAAERRVGAGKPAKKTKAASKATTKRKVKRGDVWEGLGAFLADLKLRATAVHPRAEERSRALGFLFPSTDGAAACKRQHLFLRWMVRPATEGVDFALWSAEVLQASELCVPCDVHVARIGHALGLSATPEPSRRSSDEITRSLRLLDPEDPTRFDFALCHLGISGGCRGRRIEQICGSCTLRAACRYWEMY